MYGAGIICNNPVPLREVLSEVYTELDLPFSPETILATTEVSLLATVENVKAELIAELDFFFGAHQSTGQNNLLTLNEVH